MLYHVDVAMPKRVKSKAPKGIQRPTYSGHARKAAQSDRYGLLQLPDLLDMGQSVLVEAEEFSKAAPLTKIVFRVQYNETLDMVVVAIPQPHSQLFIKTVWFNETNDTHKTLDTNRFAKGN